MLFASVGLNSKHLIIRISADICSRQESSMRITQPRTADNMQVHIEPIHVAGVMPKRVLSEAVTSSFDLGCIQLVNCIVYTLSIHSLASIIARERPFPKTHARTRSSLTVCCPTGFRLPQGMLLNRTWATLSTLGRHPNVNPDQKRFGLAVVS